MKKYCDICGKLVYMYNNPYTRKQYRCCEPELVEKYRWKALPINNKEDLLWFCCSHTVIEILKFRDRYEKYEHRFR